MRKSSFLKLFVSWLLLVVVFLISCNVQPPTPAPVPAARYQLSGYLDTLFMPVSVFDTLHKKIHFRFYIEAPDTLTLRGWSTSDSTFSHNPDVILYNGRQSDSVKFGPTDYFGNLHLSKVDIRTIQGIIARANPTPTYVLFAPALSSTYAGQITYNIYLTTDDPHFEKIVSKTITPTGVSTNPSPPANQ
jgi:hypothetical protein